MIDLDFTIIPECYVDTSLIEAIVPPKQGYNHQKGCSVVAKTMMEHKQLKDGFALGIIDKDKKEVDYALLFDEIACKEQLKLMKHPDKPHYLIQIVGGMEKWILQNAASVAIQLSDYELPNDFETLKKISKSVKTKKDDRFKRLFKALKSHKAAGVMLLHKWVTHLKSNPYDADLDFLKED
jgi:mannose-6-phosphate isomerase class I